MADDSSKKLKRKIRDLEQRVQELEKLNHDLAVDVSVLRIHQRTNRLGMVEKS